MKVSEVIQELVALHRETQIDGGYDDDKIGEKTRPLDDLQGFDSLLIPQMIRQLARKLGHPLEKGMRVKNIYRIHGQNQTIREIANKFCEVYVKEVATV